MIHHLAEVKSNNIGEQTDVWQFSVVLKNAVIGKNCNINCHVFVENDVIIGNNVTVKSGVQLWDGLRIEDNVFIGPNVTFTNDMYPRSKKYPGKYLETIIKQGASIGANSTILSGTTIGDYSFVGAGSLITKSVPAFNLWYGNPATHKGYVTKDGKVIGLNLKDKDGNRYILKNNLPKLLNE